MLKGNLCFITGGGRGIGEAVALAFAREGANLVLVSRSANELELVADKCLKAGAGEVNTRPVDLCDPAATDAVAVEVLEKYGRVDVLVNNAGMVDPQNMSALRGDPEVYDKVRAPHSEEEVEPWGSKANCC